MKNKEVLPKEILGLTLAQGLNEVIKGVYRSLEVDFTDAQGMNHTVSIYRCSPGLVRCDFKVKS